MNISYNWLKKYINLTLSPEETAKKLTSLGLEVGTTETIQSIKGGLEGLVVAKVVSCEDHPNSDHLHITLVDAGDGQLLQVVCGAANCRAGLTTILATVGTKLYSGEESFTIKKSKIRGVESFGMLCAEDEIGIGTSHEGIIELPEGTALGVPAKEYSGANAEERARQNCLEPLRNLDSSAAMAQLYTLPVPNLNRYSSKFYFESVGKRRSSTISVRDQNSSHSVSAGACMDISPGTEKLKAGSEVLVRDIDYELNYEEEQIFEDR